MIRYHIPSDGDDANRPNVFQLPSSKITNGSVLFGDVASSFPLPGKYHFRFKKKFRDGFVWVDMMDPQSVVPTCDGVYSAKVSRLASSEDDVQQMQQQNQERQSHVQGREGVVTPPPASQVRPRIAKLVSTDTIDGGGDGGDLLGMGAGSTQTQADDLLGMFESANHTLNAQASTPPMQRVNPTLSPAPPMMGIGHPMGASSPNFPRQQQPQQQQSQQQPQQQNNFANFGQYQQRL